MCKLRRYGLSKRKWACSQSHQNQFQSIHSIVKILILMRLACTQMSKSCRFISMFVKFGKAVFNRMLRFFLLYIVFIYFNIFCLCHKSHDRNPNHIILISGRTGIPIGKYMTTPNSRETYMSPVIHERKDGSQYVLLGTGGETVSGKFHGFEKSVRQNLETTWNTWAKSAYHTLIS